MQKIDPELLEKSVRSGVHVVTEESYGLDLMAIQNRPPAMFAWGQASTLKRPMIAIIGTRAATTYGKAVARKFASAFARSGAVVLSGGALGIDSQAHEGALEAGGPTIAVLANGVEHAQPPKNKPLFDRIRESGCLVSPFAVGMPALEYCFPIRNSLIAAMAKAVLLVEAPERSGASMACTAAAELGRPVYVVPGTIDMPHFRGSHNMIRDGATLVYHPDQVLEDLQLEPLGEEPVERNLTSVQQSIVDVLSANPQPADMIVGELGLEPPEVLSELTLMELDGVVVKTELGYSIKP